MSTRGRAALLIGLAAIALAAVVFAWLPGGQDRPAGAPADVATPRVVVPPSARPGVAAAPTSFGEAAPLAHLDGGEHPATAADAGVGRAEQPLSTGRFAVIRPQLEARAMAGDARAAYRLVRIYAVCRGRDADGNAVARPPAKPPQLAAADDPLFTPASHAEIEQEQARAQASRDRLCEGLGRIPGEGRAKGYWHWLQVAADAGSTEAMITFARQVVRFYPQVEGEHREPHSSRLLGRAEDIARYREQAVGYLQRALRQGDPRALAAYAREYAGGSLFAPDPLQACAYVIAWRSTAAMQNPLNRLRSWAILSREQALLDPAQRQQARALAAQIEARFAGYAANGAG